MGGCATAGLAIATLPIIVLLSHFQLFLVSNCETAATNAILVFMFFPSLFFYIFVVFSLLAFFFLSLCAAAAITIAFVPLSDTLDKDRAAAWKPIAILLVAHKAERLVELGNGNLDKVVAAEFVLVALAADSRKSVVPSGTIDGELRTDSMLLPLPVGPSGFDQEWDVLGGKSSAVQLRILPRPGGMYKETHRSEQRHGEVVSQLL
jgi:hypothetical protein